MTYSDDWHPTTDGQGFSLVAKRVVPPGAESAADDWRPRWETHGSPGRPDEQVRTQFTEIRLSAEGVVLLFPVPAGREAVVQYTDALGQAEWQAIKTTEAANQARAVQVIDSAWPSRANRFYRLLLKPRE